jgi:hypothetical protein
VRDPRPDHRAVHEHRERVPADGLSGAPHRSRSPGITGATWPRVAVIVAVLALAFVVARSCQQAQVRLTKEQAIERAEQQVDFTPTRTAVRLLRQGLSSKPFWIVSLSIPRREGKGYRRLAVVRIDANSGKVAEVTADRGR